MLDEVVIAGGGVIGLALAFELLGHDCPVRVLLPAAADGTATHTAAGMLAPVSEADVAHPTLVPLAMDSLGRYPDFVARVEAASGMACGYRREGTLWVALHRDHRAELEHLAGFMGDRGLTAERLDARRLRRLEGGLSPRVVGGFRIPGDHQVDPRALRDALLEAIRAKGGRVEHGVRVVGSVIDGGALTGLRVTREHAEARAVLPCRQAILATGAWLGRDFEGPLPDCGMRPVRGQVLRLHGPPLLDHVIRTPDVYLVPRADGRLVVGASSEEMGFDTRVSAGATFDLLRHAIAAVPEIQELALEEISVGLRPATRDHLPVMGATAVEGLHLCGGHFRNGILLAPGSGFHLARQIVSGVPESMLTPFDPRRFEDLPCPTTH